MIKCCDKWISRDIVRISGEDAGGIEHLFKYCPECGKKLRTIEDILEERINQLRYCDWLSSNTFFRIRSFLLKD